MSDELGAISRNTVKAYSLAIKEAAKIVEDFASHYPIDVFPVPDDNSSSALWGAHMARHVCKVLSDEIRKLSIKRNDWKNVKSSGPEQGRA